MSEKRKEANLGSYATSVPVSANLGSEESNILDLLKKCDETSLPLGKMNAKQHDAKENSLTQLHNALDAFKKKDSKAYKKLLTDLFNKNNPRTLHILSQRETRNFMQTIRLKKEIMTLLKETPPLTDEKFKEAIQTIRQEKWVSSPIFQKAIADIYKEGNKGIRTRLKANLGADLRFNLKHLQNQLTKTIKNKKRGKIYKAYKALFKNKSPNPLKENQTIHSNLKHQFNAGIRRAERDLIAGATSIEKLVHQAWMKVARVAKKPTQQAEQTVELGGVKPPDQTTRRDANLDGFDFKDKNNAQFDKITDLAVTIKPRR